MSSQLLNPWEPTRQEMTSLNSSESSVIISNSVDRVYTDIVEFDSTPMFDVNVVEDVSPSVSEFMSLYEDGLALENFIETNFLLMKDEDRSFFNVMIQFGKTDEQIEQHFNSNVDYKRNLIRDMMLSFNKVCPQGWDVLGIMELSGVIKEGVDKLLNAAERVNPNVTAAVDAVDRLSEAGKGMSESFISLFQKPIVGGLAVMATAAVLSSLEDLVEASTLRVVKILVSVCALMYVSTDYIKPLLTPWLKSIVPQGDLQDWGSLLLEGISIASLGCSIDVGWDTSQILLKLARISEHVDKVEKLTKRVCDWFIEVIYKLADYFHLDVSEWVKTNDTEIRALQKLASQLMVEYHASPMSMSSRFVDRVAILSMRVNDLSTRIPVNGNVPVRIALTRLQDQMSRLIQAVGDAGSDIGDRDEPGFVILAGAPGVGKTYLGDFLSEEAIVHCVEDEAELAEIETRWKSQVYPWPLDAKHHDMYSGQKLIMFPDLFCAKDARGVAGGEPQSIVYLVGGQSVNLPAADITKKQRLWMKSRVLMAMTNLLHISKQTFDSINNPDAVIRRVNEFGYFMYVNPKYIKRNPDGQPVCDPATNRVRGYESVDGLYGMIDETLIPAGIGLHPDLYLFRKLDFSSGSFVDDVILTQTQYVSRMKQYLTRKKSSGTNKKKRLDEHLSDLVEKKRLALKSKEPELHADHEELTRDPEFKERTNTKSEEAVTLVTADDGLDFNHNYGGRKGKYYPKIPRRPRHRGIKPQGDDAEISSYRHLDWFDEMDYDDQEAVRLNVRNKFAFFRGLSKMFTRDVHERIRYIYWHVRHGCTSIGGVHQCNKPSPVPDVIGGGSISYANFLRMLAIDHTTVSFTKRFNAHSLAHLALHSYEECLEKLDLLFFQSMNPGYGASWASFEYMFYTFNKMFMNLYNHFIQPVIEWIAPYAPIVNIALEFLGWYVLGTAIGTGLALLLGTPSGLPFVDKHRMVAGKAWPLEYIKGVHKAERTRFVEYSDYDAYKAAGLERDGDDLIVPIYNRPILQADWADHNRYKEVRAKVEHNCFQIYMEGISRTGGPPRLRHPCQLIFLGCRTAVMVHHGMSGMEWQNQFRTDHHINMVLVPFGSNCHPDLSPLKYKWSDVIVIPDPLLQSMDMTVIKLSTGEFFPRLEKMIPPKACVDYLVEKPKLEAIFLQKPSANLLPDGDVKCHEVFLDLDSTLSYDDSSVLDGHEPRYTYTYRSMKMTGRTVGFKTVAGDCTSPALIIDNRKDICAKLFGYAQAAQPWLCYLHTCAHVTISKGVPIYRELFQKYFDEMKLDVTPLKERLERTYDITEAIFSEELNIAPQGCKAEYINNECQLDNVHLAQLSVNSTISLRSMSDYKRSPVFGIDPMTRFPARLNDYDDTKTGIHYKPLASAIEVYGSNSTCYPDQLMDSVCHDTVAQFMSESGVPYKEKYLSFEQAIRGDKGHFLSPMRFDTSSGYFFREMQKRFNIENPKGGSKFMVDDDNNLKPEYERILKRVIDYHYETIDNGDEITSINIDNLKSELLPLDKIKGGKARLFCSSDRAILTMFRMEFGSFTGWMFENRIRNGFAVGINPSSGDWEATYDHLEPEHAKLFIDYSKFDKKQKERLMKTTQYASDAYYADPGSRHQLIRHALLRTIFRSCHIVMLDGVIYVYYWEHGNTSGNFLTTFINGFTNKTCVNFSIVCAQLIAKGYDPYVALPSHVNFNEIANNTPHAIVGDDLVLTVKGPLLKYLNFNSFTENVKKYIGLDATDELKGNSGGEVPPLRMIEDGSLIGRKFVKDVYRGRRRIKAPLRIHSCIEHIQWIKGVLDPEIEIAKFEMVNLSLSEHTREVFNSIVPRYAEACKKAYGRYPRFTDYDEANDRLMSFSVYRYSFESFWEDDTYLESDLFRLGLLEYGPLNLPSKTINNEAGRLLDASNTFPTMWVGFSNDVTETSLESKVNSVVLQADMTDFESNVTQTVQGTTLFVESAPMVLGNSSKPTFRTSTYVEQEMDIKAFLAKPLLLSSGTWTTSQAINTNLVQLDVDNILTANDMTYSKIKGFNLFKGDYIIEVRLNTSMFHQGMLISHYLPCYQQFLLANPKFGGRTNRYLESKVQHPHVPIDCRKGGGSIRIPYIAPTHFWGMKEDTYDWGTWFLDIFSPLQTGTAAPAQQLLVDYLVYGYWENVELAAPVVPQSNSRERAMRNVVPEKEENAGPIETGLRKVGGTARLLDDIPFLSDFAMPVAWMADIAANIASIWGWSKPRELQGVTVVSDQLLRYAGTSDGPDLAIPGGIICNNRIQTIDYGSFTDVDEMSMDYLLRIPFYAGELSWTAGVGQGYSLLSTKINPQSLYTSHSDTVGAHTGVYGVGAPLFYLSRFFKFWRGGIDLTLRFIKTQIHSGRIEVIWTPGTLVTTTPTTTTSVYSMRTIIDVRTEDEITINLPFLVLSDYLEIPYTNPSSGPYMGQLDIQVLNDLRAPESAAQNIAIQYFYKGGDDFEFAVPAPISTTPIPYIPQGDSKELFMHGESAGLSMGDSVVGGIKTKRDETFHASRCIGEKIKSVKQLLLRNTPFLSMGAGTPGQGVAVYPHGLGASTLQTGSGAQKVNGYGGDMYDWMVPMYAFYRGGVRISCLNTRPQLQFGQYPGLFGTSDTISLKSAATAYVANHTSTSASVSAFTSNNPPVYPCPTTSIGTNGNYVYQHIPYYNKYPMSLTVQFNGLDTPLTDPSQPVGSFAMYSGSTAAGVLTLQRAVADDFHTSFFIGCPPVFLQYT